MARRGIGKSLVGIGLSCSAGLAIATPLAFTAQVATPLQLLFFAALAVSVCFALILTGDLLADFSKNRNSRSSADIAGLPKARDMRVRASDAQAQPAPALAPSSRTKL